MSGTFLVDNWYDPSHWRMTREAWLGATLEEACPKGTKKWDDQWAIVQKGEYLAIPPRW